MPAAPVREESSLSSASPPVADTLPPVISMSWPVPYAPPPIPAAPAPPTASTVPLRMVMLLPVLSIPPPMPAPPRSPPSAVREPLVSLSSLMVRVPSDLWPSFSRPALKPPLFSSLSPSSSILVSPLPVTLTAALPSSLPLTSIFRSSKVTSTSPSEVSMVTVFFPDSPVMTVSVSSTSSFSPCVTLFVPSASPAFTVMSPLAMSHRAA